MNVSAVSELKNFMSDTEQVRQIQFDERASVSFNITADQLTPFHQRKRFYQLFIGIFFIGL